LIAVEKKVEKGGRRMKEGKEEEEGANDRYLPSTSLLGQPTTTSYTWDKIYRPTPRPITMEHDERRLVDVPVPEKELKFFKGSDEGREGRKGANIEKQYWRDEL
jgi:ribonuclease T2